MKRRACHVLGMNISIVCFMKAESVTGHQWKFFLVCHLEDKARLVNVEAQSNNAMALSGGNFSHLDA